MVSPIDFSRTIRVVELGGGTGAITRQILKRLRNNAQLFVFEPNPVFAKVLRHIDDPRLHIIEAPAQEMKAHLHDYGVHKIDHVVSSIPMVLFPEPLIQDILVQSRKLLRKGGLFVQLHHTTLMKLTYQRVFGNVSVNFVPLNIPPAFIMVSCNGVMAQPVIKPVTPRLRRRRLWARPPRLNR